MKDSEIFQKQKTLVDDFDYLNENINLAASIQFTRERLFKTICKRSSNIDLNSNFNKIIEPTKNHKIILENVLNEFTGRDSIIKRVFSMPDISNLKKKKKQNQNIINELNEDNINQIIENNNINNHDISNIIEESFIEVEHELENPNKKARSNSFSQKKEMTNKYYEENEKNGKNIFKDNFSGEIQKISINLLLQKIIFEDFLKRKTDMINHFCQQCFCFIKVNIFFEKIINCYKYYRKKNIKIEKLMNLIDFFNALVIEMIEYYKVISKNDLKIVNKVYNTILSDLMKNINSNREIKEDKITKKDLLNKDVRGYDRKKNPSFKFIKTKTIKEEDCDIVIIEKNKYFFSEKIYNEQKEKKDFIKYRFKMNNMFGYGDFENFFINPIEKMIINIKKILSICKCENPINELSNARNVINFYKYLKKAKINNHDKNVDAIIYYDEQPEKRKKIKEGFFSLFDWSVEEIGDELIRITDKMLNKIEKRELYRAKYLKKDKEKNSPNVLENINYSDNLTTFIIEDIASYDSSKNRAAILDKWARIAEYCRAHKDYNDCFAINAAFNSYFISGLKTTNKKLKTKNVKNIKDFCTINGNYKKAREEIKQLNNKNEYYYPFLGMILRDINFYEESSKYLVDGELINFEKIENIQNILDNNFYFKSKDNTKIQCYKKELSFFEKLEKYSEQYLESIVDEIEPKFTRNNGKKKFKKMTSIDKKYIMKIFNDQNDF